MHQRLFWITIIVLLLTFSASAQENWKLVKEEAGIKVYTKTESGSKYKAFKAEMQVSCKIENYGTNMIFSLLNFIIDLI
jgi:hypothetical protein